MAIENSPPIIEYFTPEYVTFLATAREEMSRYKAKHGRFASTWHQLYFQYDCMPHNITDDGLLPNGGSSTRWHPKHCRYTYVIRDAGQSVYRIDAVNQSGDVEFYQTQTMTRPTKVRP